MVKLVVNTNNRKSQINKNIYGHFSEHLGRCIYNGLFVGTESEIKNKNGIREDVAMALKEMKIPLLRWPGGCFADEYHWKDGIGKDRKKMINTNWGGVVEDNSFGTHEFLELCDYIDCEPYITGNVGSGTVKEFSEWIEYMNFDGVSPMTKLREENGQKESWNVKYIGVGNENWGCGGNMRPEYYADEYKRYSTFLKNYGDKKLYKIACGPNTDDYKWTEVMMKNAKDHMDALALHYYSYPNVFEDNKKGSATNFTKDEYYKTINHTYYMEELLQKHISIMERYDKDNSVDLVVDEWGTWYDVEEGTNPRFLYQQNTMRDALVAGINLNLFNKYSHKVKMANIAQTVNVLQSVILTEGEKLIKTPTYHVFKMYSKHQDTTLLDSYISTNKIGVGEYTSNDLSESSSIDKDGNITITICNIDLDESKDIDADILDYTALSYEAEIISGKMDAHNTFDDLENVKTESFTDISLKDGGFSATIPPCSVVSIYLKNE